MNTKINQDIVEKIQKLFALGQSPNEHEAKRAIEHAQRLLLKYNLTVHDIADLSDDVKETTIETGTRQTAWKTTLLNILATRNNSMMIIYKSKGSFRQVIIAKEMTYVVIENMYKYLVETIDRLADEYEGKGVRMKNSYRLGLVSGINEKLAEIAVQQRDQGVQFEDGSQVSALMIIKNNIQEQKDVQKYVEDMGKIKSTKTRSTINHNAYSAGRRDGKNVNLSQQLKR